MARCKLTSMNLRNIRKSREYQALLIDLVAMGVVGRVAAEETLGYTIPAGLLSADTVTPDDEETGGEGSGSEQGSGGKLGNIAVTLLYFNDKGKENSAWLTAEYDLTDGHTAIDICNFAKTEFSDDSLNAIVFVEENPEYVEGESIIITKYKLLNPQPETIEPGMLIKVYYDDDGGK